MYSASHANYTGQGTGEVDSSVKPGDTATVLAPSLVKLGVIAATDPFVDAAKQIPTGRPAPGCSGCTST